MNLNRDNSIAFDFYPGKLPILVSFPHNGSEIPDEIAEMMTPAGTTSRDTDWFLDRLYDVPELANAHQIVAKLSRYVIDLNRPSDNRVLYPGQTSTGLVPEFRFDGQSIYQDSLPDEIEIQRRVELYWKPYHDELHRRLTELRKQHGFAVLIEAHSIPSQVPQLFSGTLPDFSIGTHCSSACDRGLTASVVGVLEKQNRYSYVVDQRFIGGYITRHFGQPENNWHAFQIELSQATYLDEVTLEWDNEKATQVQSVFSEIFQSVQNWVWQHD
ncbi:MAG: N-formylglutamate deformylase [Planctomycetota bacterium]